MAMQIYSLSIIQIHFTAKQYIILCLRLYTFDLSLQVRSFFSSARGHYTDRPSSTQLCSSCHLIFFHKPIPSNTLYRSWKARQLTQPHGIQVFTVTSTLSALCQHEGQLPLCFLPHQLTLWRDSRNAVKLLPSPFKCPLGIFLHFMTSPLASPVRKSHPELLFLVNHLFTSSPTSPLARNTQSACREHCGPVGTISSTTQFKSTIKMPKQISYN